jgi:hypothetical protein
MLIRSFPEFERRRQRGTPNSSFRLPIVPSWSGCSTRLFGCRPIRPTPINPALLFKPVKRWVERALLDQQHVLRNLLNPPRDLPAVFLFSVGKIKQVSQDRRVLLPKPSFPCVSIQKPSISSAGNAAKENRSCGRRSLPRSRSALVFPSRYRLFGVRLLENVSRKTSMLSELRRIPNHQ